MGAKLSITVTNIFNFKSQTECEKYIASHRDFIKSLKFDIEGIQEIHWVRAIPVSVLTFAIVDTIENFETISTKLNQWREKLAFDIHDMLVFDGDLIGSVRR